MSDRTAIAWTDATWNPVIAESFAGTVGWACTKVSAGCVHCYAERINRRLGTRLPYTVGALESKQVTLALHERTLTMPLHWRKPRRVFVCSMTDLFHERVPDEWIDRVFAVMALVPQHTFQILTKRPERMRDYMSGDASKRVAAAIDAMPQRTFTRHLDVISKMVSWVENQDRAPGRRAWLMHAVNPWPLSNVWLGVSIEDQASADVRVPLLLQTPAAVRFLSCEPLLGPIDLDGLWGYPGSADSESLAAWPIQWVIIGGESGPSARPCDLAWIRDLLWQANMTPAATFIKQLGARTVNSSETSGPWPVAPAERVSWRHRAGADPAEWPSDLRVQEWPR